MNTRTTALLAGAIGGLVGTAAMATAGQLWSRIDRTGGPTATHRRRAHSGVGRNRFAQSEPRSHENRITPSEVIARHVPGVDSPQSRRFVGSLVHYGFGAAAGLAYAAALQKAPPSARRWLTSGRGLLYGTIVWLLADEIGLPMTGLAPTPRQTPARLHAYALAGHLAYGLALEQTRRAILHPQTAWTFTSPAGGRASRSMIRTSAQRAEASVH